ncbi:hypothetical protein [Ornithinimicrobium cerasi]|uniref:Uncharacterized protein n=1 Tax=Ornithinimicrobium cerasi TaxID=2248773 RepID=A0A285VI42_9MICO|nr:hypothetical protein [Ornithinimicrobium cerasi]SOC53745.1 hypothetical protein SAMN05421879_102103 [Ornithinimicrobium cerasi]
MTRRAWTAVSVGAVVGLTWAAGLRVWMAQLVGEESTVGWLTLALVLLPGAGVGALLGWATGLRAEGLAAPRWVVLAPALFAVALLDPEILAALVRTGEGVGALLVVVTALTGGVALARRRWSAGRVVALVVWVLGMTVITLMGTMTAPLSTARGAWVCLLGGSLLGVLSVASTLGHPEGSALRDGALPWVGAVAGLAWAGSLRGFMAEVVGDGSGVSWIGTFGWVLLPGTLAGALLGWAAAERRRGRPHRVLVWSPLLFVAVLLPGLADLGGMLEDGVGGGAVGVPLALVVGAYAVAARRAWVRAVCGVTFVAALAVWVLTATAVGGPRFALDNPYGIWTTILYLGLLVTGAVATAIPLRGVAHERAAPGHDDAPPRCAGRRVVEVTPRQGGAGGVSAPPPG